MTKKPPVVLLAPGGGLGHIVRVSAIALQLEKKEIPSLIVTTSSWAEGLGRITGLPTTVIHHKRWGDDIFHYLEHISPGVIVQDSFPFGFKHEDLTTLAEKFPFIYLARILKTGDYLSTLNKSWDPKSPLLSTIIKTEPLPDEQNCIINDCESMIYELGHRICFPFRDFVQPLPQALDSLLKNRKIHLVVHSGPLHEVEMLIGKAETAINNEGEGEIVIINPISFQRQHKNAFDYFPAAAIYSHAYHIYTGGGYNAVAEQEFFKENVTQVPFERYYDDQYVRVASVKKTGKAQEIKKRSINGLKQGDLHAAEIIAGVYSDALISFPRQSVL